MRDTNAEIERVKRAVKWTERNGGRDKTAKVAALRGYLAKLENDRAIAQGASWANMN